MLEDQPRVGLMHERLLSHPRELLDTQARYGSGVTSCWISLVPSKIVWIFESATAGQ